MENKSLAVQEKNISDNVLNRVKALEKEGNLQFPPNYSYSNAIKSAWLMLQETVDRDKKPVLQSCSQVSVANALLNMVIQGLSPAKKQCYFIAYGGVLQLSRSYMGTVAVTKRLKGVKDVKAYCIYDGDEFDQEYDIDTATLKITKFNPKFENIDISKIKGAFAVVIGENGPIHTEVMNINQIKNAWGQGTSYNSGKSTAHNKFTEEMAKKTVINRACKMFANTSDDSDILIEAFNNSDKESYDDKEIVGSVDYEVNEEIKEKANTKEIDIETNEDNLHVIDVVPTPSNTKQTKLEVPGF
ncbi:RecT family recombinase [Clostridium sp. YIM B02551]|uniref:recombinase RecT n=1 Tax=Clostridium sp. YIM B02551 TaxID=2910679 RepID=UPI001EECDAE8|nr:RecT family recombinase [Clostridium sp. YIM B02551]